MPCFSGLVGRNVLDDSESRSLGAELLTSPRLRMLTMCRNGWTSVTEVGCALEKGAPVPLFLDYTTDQDLWHGSSETWKPVSTALGNAAFLRWLSWEARSCSEKL